MILLGSNHQNKGTTAFQKCIDSIIDLLLVSADDGRNLALDDPRGKQEMLFMAQMKILPIWLTGLVSMLKVVVYQIGDLSLLANHQAWAAFLTTDMV